MKHLFAAALSLTFIFAASHASAATFDSYQDGNWNATSTWEPGFIGEFGSQGSGDGQFFGAEEIAGDSSGNIYIADNANHRIQKLDADGNFISKWGSNGTAEGEFANPSGIALDSVGNVYVTELINNRIQKFDSSGNFIEMYGWGVDTGASAYEICTSGCQAGTSGVGDGQFARPTEIAIDLADNIYVSEETNDRIQKFDSSGNFITKWGSEGTGEGQFNFPNSIAINDSNEIHVVDLSNQRIQKFDSSGNFIEMYGWGVDTGASAYEICTSGCQAGSNGSGDGQFFSPSGMDIDQSGEIFVMDGGNDRIQKFDADGNFVAKWSSLGGTSIGGSRGLLITDEELVYVMDISPDRVHRLRMGYPLSSDDVIISHAVVLAQDELGTNVTIETDASLDLNGNDLELSEDLRNSGTFSVDSGVLTVGGSVSTDGTFNAGPGTLTLGGGLVNSGTFNALSGSVVFEGDSNTIGGVIEFYDLTKTSAGSASLSFFGGATTTVINSLMLEGVLEGLLILDKTPGIPDFSASIGSVGTGDGQFDTPHGIVTDAAGNIYVSDKKNHRIQKFDADGNFLLKWGSNGTAEGQFDSLTGIDLDSSDNLWVTDNKNHRVQKFDSSGNFVAMYGWGVDTGASAYETCTSGCQAGIDGSGDGQFDAPHGIAFDSEDNYYVSNYFDSNVQKFSSDGTFLDHWVLAGGGPDGVFVDANDNVYVAEVWGYVVSKFDSDGNLLLTVGTGDSGSGNGALEDAHGVAVDAEGNIFVADTANHQISVFSSEGAFQSLFGESGSGDGQFNQPYHLTFDPDGDLLVAGGHNDRIQRFTFPDTFTIDPQGDVSVEYLSVSNSINAAATAIDCTTGCVDDGNNTNWLFAEEEPEGEGEEEPAEEVEEEEDDSGSSRSSHRRDTGDDDSTSGGRQDDEIIALMQQLLDLLTVYLELLMKQRGL